MQNRSKPRKGFRARVGGVAVASLAIGLAGWVFIAQDAWKARYWQGQLEAAPEDEIHSLAIRIAGSGEEGIDALVACLGSPREDVRGEVRLALDEELSRWAKMPAKA